ncbi:MAG: hypothetical protein LBB23_01155 [Rickettsiales bacterium]|jgi:hypothetical protein|nr:hypothetical protein [Rickettsiales bacterium]
MGITGYKHHSIEKPKGKKGRKAQETKHAFNKYKPDGGKGGGWEKRELTESERERENKIAEKTSRTPEEEIKLIDAKLNTEKDQGERINMILRREKLVELSRYRSW